MSGLLGSRMVNPSADLDEETLKYIADTTGGTYGYQDLDLQATYSYGGGRADITLINALGTHRPQTDSELRAMLGVTPMIGLNDVAPEVFTLDDARYLVGAAQTAGAGFSYAPSRG